MRYKWGDWAGRARILCYVRWLRNTLPTMGNTWQTIDKYLFVSFQCVSVAFVQDDWRWFVYQCNSGLDSAAAIAVRCCGAHASFRTAPATLFASLRGYVLSERLVLPVRACTARGGTNASGNNGESDKFSSCATNISQCFSAPWIPRCFAVHLPNSIGAGNRTIWRELLFKGMLEGFQQLVAFRATFSFSFHVQIHFSLSISYSFHYFGTTKTKNLHFSKECWVMPGKSHPEPGRCFPALGQILRYTCAFAQRN